MRRALRLIAMLSLTPFVALAASAPIELEPINGHIRMSVDTSDELEQHFHALSVSGDGAFVGLGRPNAKVDIWAGDGGKTATLGLSYREDRRAHVVMLGDPCVAVTAVGARMDASAPSPGAAARPLELWSCESGKRIAQIRHANEGVRNDLFDLVALSACGLVVAAYSDRVTVVDVASRAQVPALSALFEDARSAAIRSYPATGGAAGSSSVKLELAARSSGDDCTVYAVVFEYSVRANALLPAKLYEVDFRRARSRLVHALEYEPVVERGRSPPTTSFAISPSGQYAAISVRRPVGVGPQVNPPRGVAEVLVIDLKGPGAVRTMDMRSLIVGVTDLAFVSETALIVGTEWVGQSTETQLFDWRTERVHPICSRVFGEPNGAKGNPRSVAVNAKHKLLAVSMKDEVRVFRYRLNPTAVWINQNCSAIGSR